MELLKNFQNLMTRHQREGFPLVAKHLGVETVAVIQFYNGKEDALDAVQQLKLEYMLKDLYSGKIKGGGFYQTPEGITKWSSKIGE